MHDLGETPHPPAKDTSELLTRLLQVRLEDQPGFANLGNKNKGILQSDADIAQETLQIIKTIIQAGGISPEAFRRVAEFGAGSGATTLALSAITREAGGTFDAIEQSPSSSRRIVAAGILLPEHVIPEDGTEYLAAPEQHEKYDLVAAFMLGPDLEGILFRQLAAASTNSLSPNGSLLITSDPDTFSVAKRIAESSGSAITIVPIVPQENNSMEREALIIPKATCFIISARSREI